MNPWQNVTLAEFLIALAGMTILSLLLPGNSGTVLMAGLLIVFLLTSGEVGRFAAWFHGQTNAAGLTGG